MRRHPRRTRSEKIRKIDPGSDRVASSGQAAQFHGPYAEVVTNCDRLARLKFSSTLPFAFTEHGALMAASVLNTPRAIEFSVFVVRAFVRLKQALDSHKELARRLAQLEARMDSRFKAVFDALRDLMTPAEPKRRPIGIVYPKEK